MMLCQTTATWSGRDQCRSRRSSASALRYGLLIDALHVPGVTKVDDAASQCCLPCRTLLVWIHTCTCAVLVLP